MTEEPRICAPGDRLRRIESADILSTNTGDTFVLDIFLARPHDLAGRRRLRELNSTMTPSTSTPPKPRNEMCGRNFNTQSCGFCCRLPGARLDLGSTQIRSTWRTWTVHSRLQGGGPGGNLVVASTGAAIAWRC